LGERRGVSPTFSKKETVLPETPIQTPGPIEPVAQTTAKSSPAKPAPAGPQPGSGKSPFPHPQVLIQTSMPSPQNASPPPKTTVKAESPKEPSTPPAILEKVKGATAFIEGKIGSGTAFVVAPGILATNNHVLQDEYIDNLRIRFVSSDNLKAESLPVRLLYRNRRRDLALLSARIPNSQEPLQLAANQKEITKGRPIAVIGHPGRFNGQLSELHAVTEGVVEGPVVHQGEIWYHLKAEAATGNSGGPVIDGGSGMVIGLLTIGLRDTTDQRFSGYVRPANQAPKPAGHTDTFADTLCIPSLFIRDAIAEVQAAADQNKLIEEATSRYAAEMVTLQICVAHQLSFEAAKANINIRLQRGGTGNLKIDEFKATHDALMDALKPAIKHVQSARCLPFALRNTIQSFVENYELTKKEAVNLSLMYHSQYIKRYDAQVKKHIRIQKELFKELQIPDHVTVHFLQ
jgi:S1-C subfamily serine protease